MARLENFTADAEKLLAVISTSGRTRKAYGKGENFTAKIEKLVAEAQKATAAFGS